MGNKKSAVGLLPTTSASLKLYRNLEAFETLSPEPTRRERGESHLCRVGQQVFFCFFLSKSFFPSELCIFFPCLEEVHIWWMCRADLINRENHNALAEGVLSRRSLFSCAHMCSPYGWALNVPLPSANRQGIPGSLTVHRVTMLRATAATLITVCLSKQP